jgi:serine/threonine protein phosphatase PrpC
LEEPIVFFGESITGRRSNNEDYIHSEQIDDKTYLFIVADGMGGSEHGEVASKLAVNTFLSSVKESLHKQVQGKQLKSLLEEGFRTAQIAVREKTENDTDHSGMGTTLVVLLIHNGSYVWGNMGDSRLYKIDSKGIDQMTRDHTYIEEVLKKIKGETINEDHLDQYSHIITRSLSGGNDKPDLFPEGRDFLNLRAPIVFLLCSDGLISKKSNKKDASDFYQTYLENPEPETFAKKLVGNAFENGSEDNISALCISFGKVSVNSDSTSNKKLLDKSQVVKWIKGNIFGK